MTGGGRIGIGVSLAFHVALLLAVFRMIRLLILINPPVPVVGVSFDEVIQKPHLELPLDRHLFKHVELEAVYDDARSPSGPDEGSP